MNQRAYTSASLGIPIVLTPYVKDGTAYAINDPTKLGGTVIHLGTMPRTEVELAGHHGRWLVQQGLIDVLEWLGERPISKHPTTHQDVLRRLRAHS